MVSFTFEAPTLSKVRGDLLERWETRLHKAQVWPQRSHTLSAHMEKMMWFKQESVFPIDELTGISVLP